MQDTIFIQEKIEWTSSIGFYHLINGKIIRSIQSVLNRTIILVITGKRNQHPNNSTRLQQLAPQCINILNPRIH